MLDPGTIKVDPLVAYTDAPGKVGELVVYDHGTYGRQILRLIRNTSGATVATALLHQFESGSSLNTLVAAAGAMKENLGGLAQCAVLDDEYAYVVVDGDALATADAAVAANAALSVRTATASGRVDDLAVTTVAILQAVCAWSVGSAALAGDTLRVRVKLL